jgi:hypothetical protein
LRRTDVTSGRRLANMMDIKPLPFEARRTVYGWSKVVVEI